MKKLPVKYFIPFVFFVFAFSKQDSSPKLLLEAKHDYFVIDNLENVYTIKEHEIIKHLSNGKFFTRFSNLKLGNIHYVDATNALRIMLFYKDFQQLVFLDNQLTQKSDAVSLEDLGLEQTEFACSSANNGFWIFNKANNELLRFDKQLKKVANTGNLKQALQTELKPNFLVEYNNNVFLNCPETGIYMFDIFGTFSKLIPLKDIKQLQVDENIIYYATDSTFCSYNFKLFNETCKTISVNKLKQAWYSKGKVFVSNRDSVFVY